jgi:hypothetical protein
MQGFLDELGARARTRVEEAEESPMSVMFPTLQFFTTLQESLSQRSETLGNVEPSDAYCGVGVGDRLFVLEFDGRACSAVAQGGNVLDLDFVVTGPDEAWRHVIESSADGSGAPSSALAAHVARRDLSIESEAEDGSERAAATMGLLQAFLDGARGLEIEYV